VVWRRARYFGGGININTPEMELVRVWLVHATNPFVQLLRLLHPPHTPGFIKHCMVQPMDRYKA
jgi:hypothetical protein